MRGRPRLVLASSSPQRRAILERLGVDFEVRPTGVEELTSGEAHAVAGENALRKALAGRGSPDELVLGVDTLVALDGAIYGKPTDAADATRTLRALSGRRHDVISGLALVGRDGQEVSTVQTGVTFRELSEGLLNWYVSTGEWNGRAGGYAIQGAGAALVRAIDGDYENVVGLPLAALLDRCPQLVA